MAQGDLRLKGSVKEIGLVRDSDRYDSFNVTIGIAIKTEGKVSYEEAERLSSKFRREYLGKDVEFVAVSIPCPYCDKVLNSEGGLKLHIRQVHPERAAETVTTPKAAAKKEKSEAKANKDKTPKKKKVSPKKRAAKKKAPETKMEKSKAVAVRQPKQEAPKPAKPTPAKLTPMVSPLVKDTKAKQLTLA